MDSNSPPPGDDAPKEPSSSNYTSPEYAEGASSYSANLSGSSSTPPSQEPARVEQSPYTPPQQYTPPQGAPTQPYNQPPPQGGYQQPQQQPYQPGQYTQQQGYPQGQYPPQGQYQQPQGAPPPGYNPPPQGYPPAGYQQSAYAQPPAAAAKKSGVPVFVWVILAVLGVFALLCGGIFWAVASFTNSAGKLVTTGLSTGVAGLTAVGFTTAMQLGEYETAHSYLAGDLANNYTTAKLKQKWEALGGDGGTFDINERLGEPVSNGDRTTIVWTVTPPGKSAVSIELTMDSEKGDWKIIDAKPDLIPNP
ncbi:MAG: hypothetical protein ABI670_03260 [Chloroflexota bacterium]